MNELHDIKAKLLEPDFLAWLRIRVTEDEGCWSWNMALKDGSIPHGKFQGRVIIVRRVIIEQVTGQKIPRGWMGMVKCQCDTCVRPSHLIAKSRSEVFKGREFTQLHKAKLAKAARAKSKYSEALVAQMRSEPGTAVEKAKAHGIHVKYLRDILSRKVWKDYSSPFAGLMAVNDTHRRAA